MASFTDIIPQFNPYIKQLPIDAMVQVGMEKQKRYDEGIQKIQTQIDNVAGLDIIKPIQRQYLQNKLNELGNNLKTVAGADFSNYQLVNSVGGMTNQIVKDSTVQSAVYSTQKVRQEQANMEAARKAGKSSPENEWWFNEGLNNWLSDNNVNTKYSGAYVEYRDIDKKLRDVADKIKEIDNSIDIPYMRDNQGNVLYDKNNKPVIDDAMLSIKVKGKPAQKILNNFYDSLDEGDKQQLLITGNYHYRGATADTFRKDINDTYANQKEMLGNQVVDWSVALNTNPNLTAAERAKIQANIGEAKRVIDSGELERDRDRKLAEVGKSTDLTDYKYKIYTQKYLTNLAKDISYQSYEQEYKTNPYAQANFQRTSLNLQAAKARQDHEEFLMTYSQKERHFAIEQAARTAKDKGTEVVVSPLGIPTDGTKPGLENLNAIIQRDTESINQLKATDGARLFPELSNTKIVGRTADGKPITEVQKAVDDLITAYNTSPDPKAPFINNNAKREFVERIRALQLDKAQNDALYKATEQHTKGFNDQIDKHFAGQAGVKIDYAGGSMSYSAKDLYQLNNVYSNSISALGRGASLDEKAFMDRYKGTRLEPVARAYVKNFKGQPLTSIERSLVTASTNIWQSNQGDVKKIVNNMLDAQSNFLAARMPQFQTSVGTLNMKNENISATVNNVLGNKFAEYTTIGSLDVRKKAEFNPDTIKSWQSGKGAADLKYTLEKNYDGSGKLVIYNGTEKQIVPLKSEEMSSFFPQYSQRNPLTDVKYRVLGSANLTTNITGGADPVNAYMSGYNIPGLAQTVLAPKVRLDVEGSYTNDGSASDKFQVRMYVNDNGVWKNTILNQKGYVTESGLQAIFDNIGTATVEDVIKYGN